MKTKIIGYVDLNNKEYKDIKYTELVDFDDYLFKQSSLSKRLIKQFINKENKAKLYKIVLMEIK